MEQPLPATGTSTGHLLLRTNQSRIMHIQPRSDPYSSRRDLGRNCVTNFLRNLLDIVIYFITRAA